MSLPQKADGTHGWMSGMPRSLNNTVETKSTRFYRQPTFMVSRKINSTVQLVILLWFCNFMWFNIRQSLNIRLQSVHQHFGKFYSHTHTHTLNHFIICNFYEICNWLGGGRNRRGKFLLEFTTKICIGMHITIGTSS